MFMIYAKLDKEVSPIPCKAVFESSFLGSEYIELHGIDERVKDNILPKAKINIFTIRKMKLIKLVETQGLMD